MLVTVANFTEAWEAHMFRLRLEAEGIPAVVSHEHHVGIYWPYALALGGAKVQVFHRDRDLARSVERRCRDGEFHNELLDVFGDVDDDRCPRCASVSFNVRPTWPQAFMLISSAIAAGIIFPLRKVIFRCEACGMTWRDESLCRKLVLMVIAGTMLIVSAIGVFSWDHLS
jgi:hypothetical protein